MDTLRGNITSHDLSDSGGMDYDRIDDDTIGEAPPLAIGTDERRMQVRAYNFWASLLVDRNLPSIEDLDPQNLPDFGPHSVLLDFSCGIENPAIVFLGDKLGAECGASGEIATLSDVPSRSLLSRITDHHLQIIANQAPIGFEAEFVNQRGAAIMYRGILLPFSSDNDTIDFIFGVINWKELADQQTTDDLLLEINQALDGAPEPVRNEEPLTAWADGPADSFNPIELGQTNVPEIDEASWPEAGLGEDAEADEPFELTDLASEDEEVALEGDGILDLSVYDDSAALPDDADADWADADWAELTVPATGDAGLVPEDAEILDLSAYDDSAVLPGDDDTDAMELADWLASAREYAAVALGSEDRSRAALYAAIGRAYDFSLIAADRPEDYAELVADAGLTVQDRAPMTPLVKLVFGATYDKTRLTEFATALGHGHRLGLSVGTLADHLAAAPGGLKGVVADERKLRRNADAARPAPRQTPVEKLARKLRQLDHLPLGEVASEGSEFTLLVARRMPNGEVVLLGEVGDDAALLERAARKLLG